MTSLPHSVEAEESVIGQMLANPNCVAEVTATLLEAEHFHIAAHKVVYDKVVDRFYQGDPIDPLTIAEACGVQAGRLWGVDEKEAVQRIQAMAQGRAGQGNAPDHALVVKRHADMRSLLNLAASIVREVEEEQQSPDEIAGLASTEAMKIATTAVVGQELVTFGDTGRKFVREQRRRIALKTAGVDIGVRFGIGAIDAYTKGIQPTELLIAGGESGVGKSGVWWSCGYRFAEQQAARPKADQIGTLILSLEMGEWPSSTRWAQMLTGQDSADMREGTMSQQQLERLVTEWGRRKDFPLILNHAGGLKLSQLRAIVSEGIRKYNVGLVIIDHFLLLQPDRRLDANQADDERVWFLKNSIAKDLNVAVVCLAHTRKGIERADKRPRLSDLRGSGMIAAFADFVGLMFRPWKYATEKEQSSGNLHQTDAEMIWEKNRHNIEGTGNFYFDARKMSVL